MVAKPNRTVSLLVETVFIPINITGVNRWTLVMMFLLTCMSSGKVKKGSSIADSLAPCWKRAARNIPQKMSDTGDLVKLAWNNKEF